MLGGVYSVHGRVFSRVMGSSHRSEQHRPQSGQSKTSPDTGMCPASPGFCLRTVSLNGDRSDTKKSTVESSRDCSEDYRPGGCPGCNVRGVWKCVREAGEAGRHAQAWWASAGAG